MLTQNHIDTIQKSWSRETCYPVIQEEWTESNSALGQCAVTALLVQDFIGGAILFSKKWDHYWNQTEDMHEIDITRSQFPPNSEIHSDEVVTREFLLSGQGAISARTQERYLLLKHRYNSQV